MLRRITIRCYVLPQPWRTGTAGVAGRPWREGVRSISDKDRATTGAAGTTLFMKLADWTELGRMDELACMDSPVHRLDARTKALVTLAFVAVVMSFPRREISALMPFLLYPVVLTSAGRIPARHIFRKLLVAAPFAVLVAIFNPVLDRQPVNIAGPFVMTGGWISFSSVVLRFVLTAWAALALVACTGMNRLCAGLEQLGVPRVFVVQLLFLYRYLFVVADEAAKMTRALELRSGEKRAMSLRVYGSIVGQLLLRSVDRAQRVYRAMKARGFDGEIRLPDSPRLHPADAFFAAACIAFFAAARIWNIADMLGSMLAGRPA